MRDAYGFVEYVGPFFTVSMWLNPDVSQAPWAMAEAAALQLHDFDELLIDIGSL